MQLLQDLLDEASPQHQPGGAVLVEPDVEDVADTEPVGVDHLRLGQLGEAQVLLPADAALLQRGGSIVLLRQVDLVLDAIDLREGHHLLGGVPAG